MALYIVATPIGNEEDISLRAIRHLKAADLVIGEEPRPVRQLLKTLEITKPIDKLNEHSDQKDIEFFVSECSKKNVVLVSDAGTPGFCDPGNQLVKACREAGIQVVPVPGASSLLTLLSMSSERIESFEFYGFLPRKEEEKSKVLNEIMKSDKCTIFMDTPYRLQKTLKALSDQVGKRRILLGIDMTKENEEYHEGLIHEVANKVKTDKREFVVLVYPL